MDGESVCVAERRSKMDASMLPKKPRENNAPRPSSETKECEANGGAEGREKLVINLVGNRIIDTKIRSNALQINQHLLSELFFSENVQSDSSSRIGLDMRKALFGSPLLR